MNIKESLVSFETRKEQAAISEVKALVERFAKSAEKTSLFKDALALHGIKIDVEQAVGFSATRILQIAREQIAESEHILHNAEQSGDFRHAKQAVAEILVYMSNQKQILSACLGQLEVLHDTLEDIYGTEAKRAWKEAETSQTTRTVVYVNS